MRILSSIVLFLLFSCTSHIGIGQRHYFIPYSVNEGLAQSQVRDIVQSEDGFLWIGTVGGISRFDGNRFKTFNKSNGLMNNLTNALYQGPNDEMIASVVGGLAFFDEEHVQQYVFEDPFTNTLINDYVNENEQLILGSNGKGLLYFTDGKISRQLDLGSKDKNFIRCLWKGATGILAGTKGGLLLIDEQGDVTVINDSISVNNITGDLTEQWIATNGDGLFYYAGGQLEQFTKKDGLLNMYIRDVCIDHRNNPWIIAKNTIQRYNLDEKRFEEIKSFDPEVTSNMKVLYADREHNIWIGTDGYGILKFTGEQFEIFSTEDGLSSNIVMDIDQEPDGSYILATYGNGAMRMKGRGVDTVGNFEGLPNLTVWSVLTRANETWLGTSDGIHILRGSAVLPFEGNSELPFPRISNMMEDSQGRVWVATRNGAVYWDGEEVITPPSLVEAEPKDVKGFVEIDKEIWFTSNRGLFALDADGELRQLNRDSGFPEDYLTCIEPGSQKDLWVGSEEGVIHYDPTTNTSVVVRLSEKLSSNIVNFAANETGERLWLGTDNGLFYLDLKEYYESGEQVVRSFNQHDGIISNECNQNAVYIDDSENVWFGTNGGLLKYQHKNDRRSGQEVIGINISDIQQNFESVLNSVDKDSDKPETNTFQYNESRLTFRFSAIHFTNPDKVTFSYRLIGLDEDWSPATKENYITYSNLSPGQHTFEVRAKINGGAWSQEKSSFSFYIAPPFWMRGWFISGCLLILGAVSFFIFRQYRAQKHRKRALEEMHNKARILGLEQQTLNAHMNRHFIFNALNSIQYYINTQDRLQANQYLTNFASLVRKNLDSSQVESISLNDELERLKLYINLEQMRFKDRFTFDVKIDSELDVEAVQVPSMILQPFVENSIMHGILPSEKTGKIEIRISQIEEGIKFTIDDNGIGIDTSVRRKNGTSHHVSNGMKITKQRIELMAKAMNNAYGVFGPYEIRDDEGVTIGTRVEIVLPFDYQRFKEFYDSDELNLN